MHAQRNISKTVLLVLVLAALAAGIWIIFSTKSNQSSLEVVPIATKPSATNLSQINPNGDGITGVLAATRSLLENGQPEFSLQHLTRLRGQLDSLGVKAASIAAQRYLDSGDDAPTKLEFKLAPDGTLKTAPSLRLFLMDYLARVDPQAAAAYAEKILRSSDSPDEWAISLRAYALANTTPDGKTYLQQKIREMFQNEAWQRNPSVGFLEAFDVIVHTRDREMTADLANWVRQTDNRALSHAAYLTLDRLIQAEPVEMLNQLQLQPDLLNGREAMRADFFARTDVRDAQQRQVLENYLLDARRSEAEWQAFAAIYPNGNYMVSHNLLTQTRTPTGDEIAARDHDALRVTREWLGDPRFAVHAAELEAIRRRLEQFINPQSGR